MPVKNGDTVQVEYTGKFEDGRVFDTSAKHGAPLEFKVGEGMVIPGFEHAVVGMKAGEEKEITIVPEEGYGPVNDELIKKVPRTAIPQDREPKVGMRMMMKMKGQDEATDETDFPVKITDVNDTHITIDINHPLAGKTLLFTIKIVKIVH